MDSVFAPGNSVVHRLDPRARLIAAVAISILLAVCDRIPALLAGLACALALILAARLPLLVLARRLAAANLFVAMIWLFLPFTSNGAIVWSWGPLAATHEGLARSLIITLKCNAILLACVALAATMTLVDFGHALMHLRLPRKLIQIFMLTVRYLGLLRAERLRLSNAMKIRAFRPRANAHAYRSIGHLAGMLLARSLDRSHRVHAAMKCRGYHGEFWMLSHFAWRGGDTAFSAVALLILALIGGLQWLRP